MNIEQLTYIVEVSKKKSLAKASQTLNISQSALSQAITRLESELNVKIFQRSRTGAITTKEGDRIIEKAQQALIAIYQIKEEAKQLLTNLNDTLRISVLPGLTNPIIDTYLAFKEKKSTLKIEVNEKASMEIIEDVKEDKIDVGFIAINKANIDFIQELNFTPIIDGKILVYAPKDSALSTTNEVITMDLLKQQKFVLYKDEYVQEFITNFQQLYGPIDIFLKTTNLDVINKAVMELGAITIGHDASVLYNTYFPTNQVIPLDIVDSFDTSFRFGWINKYDNKLSAEALHFINQVNTLLMNQK